MTTTEKEKAESVVSKSSKKKKNRKKRARQWTGYVDNLKTTIDCMYEMCRSEQSVAGCREAMLYLQSASNDFKSLIETINVEKEWSENQESQKRPSVAWEIRKSMSSPNPTSIKDKPLHPISSIIAEAVKNVSPTQESSEKTAPAALTYARITAAAAVAAVAVSHPGDSGGAADGWKVVSNRRRKSTSSTTVSEFDREMSVEKEKETNEQIPLNVYERLSSNSYKRGSQPINRTLTCPRSAMDLPQTRASMAKMAYSRQLLWEKNQQVLVEKLRAKQKKEKSTRQCGFTFADPQAVRKSVEAFNQQKSNRKGGKFLQETTGSQSSTAELHSIHEESGHPCSEHSEDLVPADPTPSSSISQPPKSTGSLFGYVEVPEELEKDEKWREMTEEEESLALEENSLNLEIKQAESISIDAELERQVEAEADNLEKEEKKRQRKQEKQEKQKKEEEMENFYKVFEEIRSLAWSELMEQEAIAQYSKNVHEPGTPVEKHEKMSSPSRRNRQKDDDDFGKRHEAKQKNAEHLRQQLQEAKSLKLKELAKRVEEVREKQEALKERKRKMLEERMQRAADNRDKNIMEVIRKAKDDDQRVMEVKFIATLQEDNKRYDLLAKDACTEEKQKQLADERARKHEEKAAKKREQEAAATARRAQMRQLSEQKEQKERLRKPSQRDSGAHPEDMLAYLHSLCDAPEVPATAMWHWPSAEARGPKECTLCSVRVCSDLEAAVHLVCSKEHQDQTKTLTSGSVLEELKRHFYGIFKDVAPGESESLENQNLREEALLKSREALRTAQVVDIPGPVSSPRNRTKSIRDFNLSIEKMTSKGQVDDKTQESVEKSLSQLLSAVESDLKAESSSLVNLEQFCAISGPQKVCDLLLEWTSRGASLRLCIRMCHAFCTFLRDPRVAYSVVFKPELIRILDKIVALLSTSSGDSPQLSALLDVLTATLKSVNTRIQVVKQNLKHLKHRELQKLDSEAPAVVGNIGKFLKTSLCRKEILEALGASKGSALCSRLITLADQFEDSELITDYVDVILKFTYSNRKSASENDEASEKIQKASKDLASSIVTSICQQSRILKTLNPERLLILTILLEDCLWRSAEALRKAPEPEKKRGWGEAQKEEEAVLKLAELMDNVVERMETWQKRSVLISWTGHSSCLQILEDVPIRLLAIGIHARRLIPTVERVLEKFTNSEKAEMLGDCSGDLFFESSMFPNRTKAN